MSGLGGTTSPRRDAHLAEKRISMLRNKKEKDIEIENELWSEIHKAQSARQIRAKKYQDE